MLTAFPRAHGGLWDHDFHPDEPDVRIFVVAPGGVRRRDDSVVVTDARHGDVVLGHYAFADRWFKVNVTLDLDGRPAPGAGDDFTFNCDVATPMQRDGSNVFAVDLFLDVLVDRDGRSYEVTDRDDFRRAVADGLISSREAGMAETHLQDLVDLIRSGRLIAWLDAAFPFGPVFTPPALPLVRGPISARMAAGLRPTW